ncbi:sugar transferase [Bordetella trematum]|uniref:sugar transferase n=1 Tax=Bordetella trematum TaxID=123899 RepID=UPI000D87E810|nr:sugar transferase [Bordetella trematum]SPU49088.1 exopolysaccharide biosynthesis glycosyl transferase [Bordetella trematum]VDH04207.1 Putative colanic biosynthesis UDP-glucose lipid carrier transferase [Bordetella trematum]
MSSVSRRVAGLLRRLGAALLLVALSPLLGVLALSVWWTMGRPVLFRQWRAGYRGRPFQLCKFRSMRAAAYDGEPDGPRLTRWGRLLRRSSLDELPGLWNIVRGEMNFIGPRPLPLEYLPRYSAEEARRHLVPPGMTGWAQVHGRNALGWEERLHLDCWYVDHASWRVDARILWRTLRVVCSGQGVAAPGHETGQELRPPQRGPSS